MEQAQRTSRRVDGEGVEAVVITIGDIGESACPVEDNVGTSCRTAIAARNEAESLQLVQRSIFVIPIEHIDFRSHFADAVGDVLTRMKPQSARARSRSGLPERGIV